MTDIVKPQKRNEMMAGIRNRDTRPEKRVRAMLHHAGFRYRLHNTALPGTPDLRLVRYRAVIEVNGCFWHGHDCHLFKLPSSRTDFWQAKLASNRARDARHLAELDQLGIRCLIIWECALKGRLRHDPERLLLVISWWLTSGISHGEIAGGRELQIGMDHSRPYS